MAQKESAASNHAEVLQLLQLMAWWSCGRSALVHVTLYLTTTTIRWLGRVVALQH